MDTLLLQLEARPTLGKRVGRLRRLGVTPVHVYGSEMASLSAQVTTSDLLSVLSEAGHTGTVYLSGAGLDTSSLALIREIQYHPTSGAVLHVDFLAVKATQVVPGEIPLVMTGEAPAVRLLDGMLLQRLRTLSVESLPLDMPSQISVDISGLEDFETAILVRDLVVPSSVTVLSNPDELVARVGASRKQEEAGPVGDIADQPVEQQLPTGSNE